MFQYRNIVLWTAVSYIVVILISLRLQILT